MTVKNYRCPKCRSTKIQKSGTIMTAHGKKQRLHCATCGRNFYARRASASKSEKAD